MMSDGFYDSLKFLCEIWEEKERINKVLDAEHPDEITGDGENIYTVLPDDPRWVGTAMVWHDSSDDEITVPIDVGAFWKDFDNENQTKTKYDYKTGRYITVQCECGSKHTSTPNLHTTWCPLYKDPMGKK